MFFLQRGWEAPASSRRGESAVGPPHSKLGKCFLNHDSGWWGSKLEARTSEHAWDRGSGMDESCGLGADGKALLRAAKSGDAARVAELLGADASLVHGRE